MALAVAHLYDQRGGGVETQNRNDKQGLGLTKRNMRCLAAQQMLVLLAQLAHNLIIWVRRFFSRFDPSWQRWGLLRWVRDVFHISGRVDFDQRGQLCRLTLNDLHPLSAKLREPLQALLPTQLVVVLDKI